MSPIKVLVLCSKLDIGGAQAVAAAQGRHAPPDFSVDYLVFGEAVGDYERELTEHGCRIFHFDPPSRGQLRFLSRLTAHLCREGYTAVHCHNFFSSGTVMLAAWLAGVPCRISHSHTTREESAVTPLRRLYQAGMRTLIRLFGNEFFACGMEAGCALYGKGWFERRGRLIPNGIDTAAYGYSADHRQAIRSLYGLEDRFVIGHVGHYVEVKNQRFLIDLMPQLLQLRPNGVLLLFGEGQDRPKLARQIEALGLQDRVRLMGNVRNIGQVLSAFDVFAFPSLFEGTPLALLEAQANGLPCLISDAIPDDACLTEEVRKLPPDPELWCRALASARRSSLEDRSDLLLKRYESVCDSMDRIFRVIRTYHKSR